ncbi:18148_t:CDS:2, partial [Racocetra persica]
SDEEKKRRNKEMEETGKYSPAVNSKFFQKQQQIKNSPTFYQQAPFLTIAENLLKLIKEDKVERLIFLSAYDKRKFPNEDGDSRKGQIFRKTFVIDDNPNICKSVVKFVEQKKITSCSHCSYEQLKKEFPTSPVCHIMKMKVIAPYYPATANQHDERVLLVKNEYLAALKEVKEAFNALGEILAANSIPEFKDLDNKKVQEKIIEELKEKNNTVDYFLKNDDKIEVGFNNHPQGFKAVVVDTEALLNNSPPHEVSSKEKKEKIKKEVVTSDSKKSQVVDETTCDRCNKNINDCKCFNEKAKKSPELSETKTPAEQAQEKELAKITGKINNTPQMGSDASGNTYYLANFTDQDSFTFPIYLWEKPTLTEKQKHRKQYWNTLIESFKKLVPETSITIEGYYWHKNKQLSFDLL